MSTRAWFSCVSFYVDLGVVIGALAEGAAFIAAYPQSTF